MIDRDAGQAGDASLAVTASNLAALYDRHAASVYGLALRMLGDQRAAEDVVEEVFLEALNQAPELAQRQGPEEKERSVRRDESAQRAVWLLRRTHQRCLERLGRRANSLAARRLEVPAPSLAHIGKDDEERTQRVREALESLPDTERQVIELMYFQGMAREEVAMQVACAYSDVLHYARLGLEKLREALLADD